MVCIAWMKGLRRVWNLPNDTHSSILPPLCDSLPVLDELYRRTASFINNCVCSDSNTVNFVARHGVFFGAMYSPIGRNAFMCCERYHVMSNEIDRVKSSLIDNYVASNLTCDTLTTVNLLLELLFIRQGSFYTELSADEVDELIVFLCRC